MLLHVPKMRRSYYAMLSWATSTGSCHPKPFGKKKQWDQRLLNSRGASRLCEKKSGRCSQEETGSSKSGEMFKESFFCGGITWYAKSDVNNTGFLVTKNSSVGGTEISWNSPAARMRHELLVVKPALWKIVVAKLAAIIPTIRMKITHVLKPRVWMRKTQCWFSWFGDAYTVWLEMIWLDSWIHL